MSSAPKPNQQKLPLIRKSVSDFLQRTTNLHAVFDDQQKINQIRSSALTKPDIFRKIFMNGEDVLPTSMPPIF